MLVTMALMAFSMSERSATLRLQQFAPQPVAKSVPIGRDHDVSLGQVIGRDVTLGDEAQRRCFAWNKNVPDRTVRRIAWRVAFRRARFAGLLDRGRQSACNGGFVAFGDAK